MVSPPSFAALFSRAITLGSVEKCNGTLISLFPARLIFVVMDFFMSKKKASGGRHEPYSATALPGSGIPQRLSFSGFLYVCASRLVAENEIGGLLFVQQTLKTKLRLIRCRNQKNQNS